MVYDTFPFIELFHDPKKKTVLYQISLQFCSYGFLAFSNNADFSIYFSRELTILDE